MDLAYAMPPCWQTQKAGCGTHRDFFSSLSGEFENGDDAGDDDKTHDHNPRAGFVPAGGRSFIVFDHFDVLHFC
jgi:hypothetical protein